MKFNEDELLGETQISSITIKETNKVANRVANKEMKENDTSLSPTANLVCNITRDNCTYFGVRSDTCNIVEAHVSKITGAPPTDVELRRPVCKTTEVSTCRTLDIADKYFSNEDNPRPKINMKIARDSVVYARAGRRRHQLAR